MDDSPPKTHRLTIILLVVALVVIALVLAWITQPGR